MGDRFILISRGGNPLNGVLKNRRKKAALLSRHPSSMTAGSWLKQSGSYNKGQLNKRAFRQTPQFIFCARPFIRP